MLIDSIMNELTIKNQLKYLIFIVPTVVLCKQQHQALSSHSNYSIGLFHGELNVDMWNIEKWKYEYSLHSVFVLTAQIFLDNLRHSIRSMSEIALIVFDECHHATKNHPYNRIMTEFYFSSSIKPKILGMTASPISTGVNKSNNTTKQLKLLQTLSENLNAKIVEASESLQIESFASHPKEIIEYYLPSPICYLEEIDSVLLQLPELQNDKRLFSQNSLLSVVNCLGSWCAIDLIQSILDKFQQNIILKYLPYFNEHLEYLLVFYEKWNYLLNYKSPRCIHDISFQAIRLIEILSNHISSISPNQQICIIVFVQTRYTAFSLKRLLLSLTNSTDTISPSLTSTSSKSASARNFQNCHSSCQQNESILQRGKRIFQSKNIQTGVLVSQNSTRIQGVESPSVTLDKFRHGLLHILVATSVAEEGLDVQPCQLVIRFQEIQTLVSYVQTRGRARHLTAKYIILESTDPDSNKFSQVRDCERLMRETMIKPIPISSNPMNLLTTEEIYTVPSTGALVSLISSISLIYQYCDNLSSDKYTHFSPKFIPADNDDNDDSDEFCYNLHLPIQGVFQVIRGTPQSKKILAKQHVALLACKLLHQQGELDDNLCPTRIKKSKISSKLQLIENTIQNLTRSLQDNWNISTKYLSTWNQIQSEGGKSLYIYSLTLDTLTSTTIATTITATTLTAKLQLCVLSSVDLFRTGKYTQIVYPLNVGNNIDQEGVLSMIIKPHMLEQQQQQQQYFTFSQLKSLQNAFGTLISNFVGSKYQTSLRNESNFLSPILLRSNDIFEWNCQINSHNTTQDTSIQDHPFY